MESRILRGATPVIVDDNPLHLIRHDPPVSWGSQLPTLWGDGKARYLDALLRDQSVPWAIEMKVEGGGGTGQYYRHGIAQSVLYREFIQAATPLHPWFENQHLDPTACRAALVVPEPARDPKDRMAAVRALCDLFEVTLVLVPPRYAELRTLPSEG